MYFGALSISNSLVHCVQWLLLFPDFDLYWSWCVQAIKHWLAQQCEKMLY